MRSAIFLSLYFAIATFSLLALGQQGQEQDNCLGCYSFIAPSKFSAETIPHPEVGLITFDTDVGLFRGFSSQGVWQTLSNDLHISTKTTSSSILMSDDFVLSNGSLLTLTLPSVGTSVGKAFSIKNLNSTKATIDGNASDPIEGSLTNELRYANDSISIVSNGSTWNVVSSRKAPTVQIFTSGTSLTYSTPPGVLYLKVRMVGGGGGGAGAGVVGGGGGASGSAGGSSSFSTLSAGAGGGGISGGAPTGGAGGTASLGSGPVGVALAGGPGSGAGVAANTNFPGGGTGGYSPFGGAGASAPGTAGGTAKANTGSGGGGGGVATGSAAYCGGGGGAGGYVDAIIYNPASTYTYTVGGGGAGGGAGTGGTAGGAGAAGIIIVEEHYQ